MILALNSAPLFAIHGIKINQTSFLSPVTKWMKTNVFDYLKNTENAQA